MEYFENILKTIGETPIVRLGKIKSPGEIYVKCEFFNPGGSIKDRIGIAMIEEAERKGLLKKGGTIVEATSGNTGMGLAIAAAVKGYQTIFVLPEKMSEEKRQNLRAFGARVVITPTGVPPESPNSHYSVAARIAQETPNSFYCNQYNNLTNREAHYQTTAPEILRQTAGEIDAIVIGMGTCGTISGIGRYLKEKKSKIKVVGVDPKGSILKELFETGKMPEAHTYLIEGIGEDMIPDNCDFSVVDEIVRVEDKESFLMTRRLLTEEGIFCGVSAGSAVVGALRYQQQHPEAKRVLAILPDSGNRYMSKVFNDSWMIENSFLDRDSSRVKDVIDKVKRTSGVITAHLGDFVEQAVEKMRDACVSQLPVLSGKKIVGMVSEAELLAPLLKGKLSLKDPIDDLLKDDFELLTPEDSVSMLQESFSKGKVGLVLENSELKHILTKIDLLSFLSQSGVTA